MPVRKANEELDVREQLLKLCGRLANPAIDHELAKSIVQEISQLLEHEPPSEAAFSKYNIQSRYDEHKDGTAALLVHVPREYLPLDMAENQPEGATVTFGIKKVLDMDFRGR